MRKVSCYSNRHDNVLSLSWLIKVNVVDLSIL